MKDIKVLLFSGYAFAYPLAVLPPVFVDPFLKSHVIYPSRHYPYAYLCALIYLCLLIAELVVFWAAPKVVTLYVSVGLFLTAIVLSLPIFLPEFPHGNVFAVGTTTSFLSAFSIFVWWMCNHISADAKSLSSAGQASFEYLKTLFAFARQGAFAGVTLFGVLFFAAFATEFKYSEATVTEKSEIFLLNVNTSVQVAFYATYCVIGVVRYFFVMNLEILSRFKEIAIQLDNVANKNRPILEGVQTPAIARSPDENPEAE